MEYRGQDWRKVLNSSTAELEACTHRVTNCFIFTHLSDYFYLYLFIG